MNSNAISSTVDALPVIVGAISSRLRFPSCVAWAFMFFGAVVSLQAQWTFTNLNPPGAVRSGLVGIHANQQVGYFYTTTDGPGHAGVWSGTAASLIDLGPSNTLFSGAMATNGTQQAGSCLVQIGSSYYDHAVLWSGTPGSYVDLHPAGFTRSIIYAMSATLQGGYASVSPGWDHAGIWSGTSASFVDLHPASHPAGFTSSYVTAMAGTQLAGYGRVSVGGRRALFWPSPTADVIYLHAGETSIISESAVYAMTANQQGGMVTLFSYPAERAALWSGSYASRVDLHPVGRTSSSVLAMAGEYQAGRVDEQAALWKGTSASYINLHTVVTASLGANFTKSAVNGAYIDDNTLYLVGTASDPDNHLAVAVMWSGPAAMMAPTMVTQPMEQSVTVGNPVTFTAAASGYPAPTYQWQKNGVDIPGATSDSFTIANVTLTQAGVYRVVATNMAGSVTSNVAVLWVIGPGPAITSMSGSRQVFALGQNMTLEVSAAGNGAISYQWLHDGLSINGATGPSLVRTNLGVADSGWYLVLATDSNGTSRSEPIFVQVVPVATEVVAWGNNRFGQLAIPGNLGRVLAVSAGASHSLALKADGTVVAWGDNLYGKSIVPTGLTDVVAVSAGGYHSLALRSNGTVVAWGGNGSGQTSVPPDLAHVVAIAASESHSVALKSDGTVVTWGYQVPGPSSAPVGLSHVIAVSSSGHTSLALKSDGTLFVWGLDITGTPQVGSNVVAFDAGTGHAIILSSDGSLYNWGEQGAGIPIGLDNVVAVSAGTSFSVALKSDHTVVAWGENLYGQTAVLPGLKHVFAISAGGQHTVALVDSARPSIIAQPTGLTREESLAAYFLVTATGLDPMTYQWRKNGVDIAGATSSTYGLPNVALQDAGDYDVVVTNEHGVESSVVATLSVIPGPIVTNLGISHEIRHPGESFNLSVAATGTGPLVYQWSHNGQLIPGASNSTLAISNTSVSTNGNYSVVVTDDHGTKRSGPIIVSVAPEHTYVRAWGTNAWLYPVPAGLTDVLTIVAGRDSAVALRQDKSVFVWGSNISQQCNVPAGLSGVEAMAAGNGFVLAVKSDGTAVSWGSSNYSAQVVPDGLGGVIDVSAGDAHSVALKRDGSVVAWGQSIYGQTNVPTGLKDVFAISAGGFHTLAIKYDGTVVAWGSNSQGQSLVPVGLSNVIAVAGGYSHSLALKSDGTVVAWGSNAYGEKDIPAGLADVVAIAAARYHSLALKADGTVVAWGSTTDGNTVPPVYLANVYSISDGVGFSLSVSDGSILGFIAHPAGQTVSMTQSVEFSVQVSGLEPIAFQWQRRPTGGAWGDLSNGVEYYGANSSALAIAGVTLAMSGDQFRCIITNAHGSVASNAASLTVTVPLPVILTQPVNQLVALGQPLNLSVMASSLESLGYQWRKFGSNIPGANSSSYSVGSAQLSDAGNYTVVVTNIGGSITSAVATVTIVALPTITTPPVAQTVIAGSSPSFSVVVTSNASPSYQWRKNGTDIPGATASTLSLTNVQGGDAANYSVVVSNIAGSVTSNNAALTVQLPPTFTLQPLAVQPLPTSTATFTVAVSSTTTVSYQWQWLPSGSGIWSNVVNGGSISGATSDTLTVGNVLSDQGGDQYRCVATNLAGSTTSDAALLTIGVAGNVKLSAGRYHSLRVNLLSQPFVTGTNTYGQLGDGTTVTATTAKVLTIPGQTVTDVAAGAQHSLLLTSTGQVWVTGLNDTGQLGDGTNSAKTTPVLLTTNAVGIAAANFHSVVLKADGTLWTVGGNDSGQLGNGTTTNTTALAQIATDVVDLAAGIRQTFYLKSDGTLWGMGDMNGSGTPVSTPVQVATNVKAVAAGGYHSLILKNDGTLWALGYNPYGQLGTGHTTDCPTPVQVASGVKAIATGYFHSAFIKTDDSLWVMGYNSSGQLGDGTTTNRPTPFQLATQVAAVSASEAYTLYTRTDGSFWGTGYNAYGQFGNGNTTTTTMPIQITAGVILAPEAPANFVAAPSVSLDRVRLTWSPQGSAASFEVWRHSSNNRASATLLASGLHCPVYEDRTVALGQAYYYWVTAVNSAGSTLSAPVTATTGANLSQVITFPGPLDQGYTTTPILLSATASSGLSVSFSLVSGPANLTGNQLTLTGVGPVTVRASQNGGPGYEAAPDVDRMFIVTGNLESWSLGYFTALERADANVSGPNADPDGDGYANLVEYALGLEPRVKSLSGLPEVTADATHWIYSYPRPEGRTDVTCVVEVSTDLRGWGAPTVAQELVFTTDGIETWQAKEPLSSASNVYFRIRVLR